MSITGGRVSFTRTVRPADFESKSATVELTFDDVGDLEAAATLAQTKALAMVGVRPAATVTVEVAAGASDKDKAEYAAKAAAAKEAEKAAAAAAKAAEKAAKDATKAKTPPKGSVPNTMTADPAAIEDDVVSGAATVADPAAIDDDSLFGGVEDAVTDAALMEAITKHNGKVKNPIAIRQLIGKYVTPPKRATEIPTEKRAAFIKELEAIKPLV